MTWPTKYEAFVRTIKEADGDGATIDETIEEYFPQFSDKKTAPGLHECVLKIFEKKIETKEGAQVLQDLYPTYRKLYTNNKTIKQRLSEVRKVIQANQDETLYKLSRLDKYWNIPEDERNAIVNAYKSDIKAKNAKKIQVDVNEVYEQMRELIMDKDVYKKIAALLIATGARPVGLFAKNKFELIKDKPSWVKVSGLAKKRKEQIEAGEDLTERPIILFTPKFVINEIAKIRNHFKNKILLDKKGTLAKDKNDTLNKRIIEAFPWTKEHHQKSSMMRKIYSSLSYKLFADSKFQNENSWIQSVLGHSSGDLMTSFSYSYLNVADSREEKNSEQIQTQIEELRNQVQMLLTKKIEPDAVETAEPVGEKKSKPRESDESKIERMEKIWEKYDGKISNSRMRQLASLGSKAVNAFMSKKKEEETKT